MTYLLTPAEVAARLSLTRGAVYAMVRVGILPAVRVGVGERAIRIAEHEVELYLQSVCEYIDIPMVWELKNA